MEKTTARLEAFSDGVFAIAITLLVLELRVDPKDGVWHGLWLAKWKLLAFLLSFVSILIMWINHHGNLLQVRTADAGIMFTNGLLLMMVTFMPFPTLVLGDGLGDAGNEAREAAGFYAASFVALNVLWISFWRSLVRRRAWAMPDMSDHDVKTVNNALAIGFASYLTAFLLAFWSAYASVGLSIVLAAFWAWQAIRRHRAPETK